MSLAWLVLIAVGVLVLVGVLAPRRRRPEPVTVPVSSTLWCPVRHEQVTVGFQVVAWNGRRTDVKSCSVFSPATSVTCDKACLPGPPAFP